MSFVMKKIPVLFLVILLLSCSPSSLNNDSKFPTNLMMNSQDLPQHWKIDSFTKMDVENAESYHIQFLYSKTSTRPIILQHQLSVYANVDMAKAAYPDWGGKWIPTDDWTTPAEFDFQPMAKDDLFRMACLNGKVDGQPILFCTYLQQHNNMITLVLAQLDDKSLNLQQLIGAIEILDIRLQQN